MASLLVLDTCGDTGYVALVPASGDGKSAVFERRLRSRATQEELLPAIAGVLGEAAVELPELAAIAVVNGPGSFTGVRIGLASAKGLCEAAGLHMVTLSRLLVLAEAAGVLPLTALLQAGRGDVYAERFSKHAGPLRQSAADRSTGTVCDLSAAVALAGDDPVAICEPSLLAAFPDADLVCASAFEMALRTAASNAVRDAAWADVALADALYLRIPDAELALRSGRG